MSAPYIKVTVTIPGNEDAAYVYITPGGGLPLAPESLRSETVRALEEAAEYVDRAVLRVPA